MRQRWRIYTWDYCPIGWFQLLLPAQTKPIHRFMGREGQNHEYAENPHDQYAKHRGGNHQPSYMFRTQQQVRLIYDTLGYKDRPFIQKNL
jgi:hypothetical protein